jgi:hypothetical protein
MAPCQAISEDLKKAMVGEEFYNRAHGIKQDPKLASEKEQTQAQKLSQTHADAALKESPSEEQKTTLSYKPPFPGEEEVIPLIFFNAQAYPCFLKNFISIFINLFNFLILNKNFN